MIITKKFIGTVKNNVDPNKKGRVQIDIPEIFIGKIPDDDLPWAKQDKESSSDIPEEGDKVWCYWHDEVNYRNMYYSNKVDLYEYNDHKKDSDITDKIPSFESKYPDIKYNYYKNGIVLGVSSNEDTPEIFIVHPKGSHIYINKDGEIDIKSSSTIQIGKESFEKAVRGEALKTYLDSHTHPTPAGPSSVPTTPLPATSLSTNVKIGE